MTTVWVVLTCQDSDASAEGVGHVDAVCTSAEKAEEAKVQFDATLIQPVVLDAIPPYPQCKVSWIVWQYKGSPAHVERRTPIVDGERLSGGEPETTFSDARRWCFVWASDRAEALRVAAEQYGLGEEWP